MSRQAVSLIDVLSPPGNRWLIELSRRKSDLPEGVRIVRFNDSDDDIGEDLDAVKPKARSQRPMAACT